MTSSRALIVFCTVPDLKTSRIISKEILKRRAAACVSISGPVESHYWWKFRIEKAKEYLLMIKTSPRKFKSLKMLLTKIHPYDVPEILAVPVQNGNSDYLGWLVRETRA